MELNYHGSGCVIYNKNEYQCDLYINKNKGGIMVKISVNNPFSNFLELPLNINFLSGELSTGYKFSLFNCSRGKTEGLVSENRTVFTYFADYMFKGVGGKKCENIKLNKVIFELADIIEWGNISGYNVEENFKISENNNCKVDIFENDKVKVEYVVEKDMLPIVLDDTLKENITLKQSGNIVISFKKEENIENYYNVFRKIKRLIEISTLRNIDLIEITGFSEKIYNIYGDRKIDRPIEIISSSLNKDIEKNNKNKSFRRWKWIILPELIENNSFEKYFEKYDFLEPVIELYLEILESNKMSKVRFFLNVVQALETYHSRFKANNLKEFKKRIEIILKDRPESFIEEDRKFLIANSKKFVTLESRIADLLIADFNIFFDTGDIKRMEFPNVIAKTRNYYIHYDEDIKENGRVLNEEELSVYNRTMIYILEYYILLELGFSNVDQIKEKLNERWGKISDTLLIIEESKKIERNNTNVSVPKEIIE